MLNDLLNDPNLHELIPLAVLFILALVLIGVLRSMLRLKKAGPVSAVYQRKAVLLSPAEAKFFEKLKSAVDDGYQVFGKVRLADIVEPRKDPGNSSQSGAYQRIASEHVDFVLVLSASMGIACVIELDDVSHRKGGAVERDVIIEEALADADVPLIRFEVQPIYSIDEIRDNLDDALSDTRELNEPRLFR